MSLFDYELVSNNGDRDSFEYDDRHSVFSFLCCVCLHNAKAQADEPCINCVHNLNSSGRKRGSDERG